MSNAKEKLVEDRPMPYQIKCMNTDCGEEIATHVQWLPPGEIHFIICPTCNWTNKRKIKRSALNAWFNATVEMRLRVTTEAIEDIAYILGTVKELPTKYKKRLDNIKNNMEILNIPEKTQTGTTDDDLEI
jgi:hypothetical protein